MVFIFTFSHKLLCHLYGKIIDSTGSLENEILYTGRWLDIDTNLYYYRARWYDAEVGRFISRDPIGVAGGINLYGYVGNDPGNKVDPEGEFVLTGCATVYYFIAATVAIGAWGQMEIWKRLRYCQCPSPQYVWDSFTTFTKWNQKGPRPEDKKYKNKGRIPKLRHAKEEFPDPMPPNNWWKEFLDNLGELLGGVEGFFR